MLSRFGIAISVLAFAAPVLAQQSPTAAATPSAPAPEKKFCRREIPTGSFMPSKPVCHTKAEWNEIDSANNDNAQDALSRRSNRLNER